MFNRVVSTYTCTHLSEGEVTTAADGSLSEVLKMILILFLDEILASDAEIFTL